MRIIKGIISALIMLAILAALSLFVLLRGSLPTLDGSLESQYLSDTASLSRDNLGTAIVNASSEYDAAYLLGYAHAQDRLFQMDLLRRQSAGELAELVGRAALNVDKKHRVHQFRDRAEKVFERLSEHEQRVLTSYTQGVNEAAQEMSVKPYEYFLVGASFAPWQATDSLLASYSMYIDLQLAQTEIDFRLTALKEIFGASMFEFFTLPSNYQAVMDYSIIEDLNLEIPTLPEKTSIAVTATNTRGQSPRANYDDVQEQPDVGSNNWAVSGELTQSKSGMLSNDMHLGLNVPAIWYRAQLNYRSEGNAVSVTGVTLPGSPAVIVGSNGHIAWGFTNSNVDNVDWIELNDDISVDIIEETINTPEGPEAFSFESSKFGPIRDFNGKKYALKWVAHQEYAVNLKLADMAKMHNLDEALATARQVRIPVQNMAIVDADGKIAWQLTGAITRRSPLARHAITPDQFSDLWEQAEEQPANVIVPENGRVWTANARVISTDDLMRYGDGGYALGARQQQIMMALMRQDSFTEEDFYNIQLDNAAMFLAPWHNLLLNTLNNSPQKYAKDIELLKNWQACACPDSVAYTLVRRFRSGVINILFAPINEELMRYELSTAYLLRGIEPAVWRLLQEQAETWLAADYSDYTEMLLASYDSTKDRLMKQHKATDSDYSSLAWGRVNALRVKHPFSDQLSFMSDWLDMPLAEGFGDSYMPAVQSGGFGASQRLIVRPGNEDDAILTIPGGQSGHFLSDFYRSGFDDYVKHANTPLLPGNEQHRLIFSPR